MASLQTWLGVSYRSLYSHLITSSRGSKKSGCSAPGDARKPFFKIYICVLHCWWDPKHKTCRLLSNLSSLLFLYPSSACIFWKRLPKSVAVSLIRLWLPKFAQTYHSHCCGSSQLHSSTVAPGCAGFHWTTGQFLVSHDLDIYSPLIIDANYSILSFNLEL